MSILYMRSASDSRVIGLRVILTPHVFPFPCMLHCADIPPGLKECLQIWTGRGQMQLKVQRTVPLFVLFCYSRYFVYAGIGLRDLTQDQSKRGTVLSLIHWNGTTFIRFVA